MEKNTVCNNLGSKEALLNTVYSSQLLQYSKLPKKTLHNICDIFFVLRKRGTPINQAIDVTWKLQKVMQKDQRLPISIRIGKFGTLWRKALKEKDKEKRIALKNSAKEFAVNLIFELTGVKLKKSKIVLKENSK